MTPFNNQVNSNSNFDFSEMKANAFPGGNTGSIDNIDSSTDNLREAVNDVGMTGVLELKRMLVGKLEPRQPDYGNSRSRSRSYGRRRQEPVYVPRVYRPITREILFSAFDASRIKASPSDLTAVFMYLDISGKNQIDFWSFWNFLLTDLSEKALEIINYLWNTLNPSKQPEVTLSKLKNRFFGKFDPDVQSRKRQEREVENEFIRNLDTYCQVGLSGGGKISKQEFDGFMKCWSFACDDERDFITRVVECFRLSEYTREFGFKATDFGGSGWRREWGTRESQESKSSKYKSGLEQQKGSMWNQFMNNQDEVKYSRRGKSTHAKHRNQSR